MKIDLEKISIYQAYIAIAVFLIIFWTSVFSCFAQTTPWGSTGNGWQKRMLDGKKKERVLMTPGNDPYAITDSLDKKATTVSSISELQDYSQGATSILVTDSLRGGIFRYNPSIILNDGGVNFTATGKGSGSWSRVNTGIGVLVKWWGAVGDGTDETDKIQAALDYVGAQGGKVSLDAKKYTVNGGLIINQKTSLIGVNGNMHRDLDVVGFPFDSLGTILQMNSTSLTLLTINSPGCTFEGIVFRNNSTSTPTDGNGLYFTYAGEFKLINCGIFGFYNNVNIESGRFWRISGCYLASPINYNLKIANGSHLSDFGDNAISDSWFTGNNNTLTHIRYEASSGLKMVNNKFVSSGTTRAKYHLHARTTVPLSDILISNCSFEGFSTGAIRLEPIGSAFFANIQISNSQFSPFSTITEPVINIMGNAANVNTGIIVNNNTMENAPGANASITPITIDNSYSVVSHDNTWYGWVKKLQVTASTEVDTNSVWRNRAILNRIQSWSASQTFNSPTVINGTLNIVSGANTGGLGVGANVNTNIIGSNVRKLGRIYAPAYSGGAAITGMIAADNDGTENYLDIGASPSGSLLAPTRIRFNIGTTTSTAGGFQPLNIFKSGNFVFQNGGTFIDNGQRIQIQGRQYLSQLLQGSSVDSIVVHDNTSKELKRASIANLGIATMAALQAGLALKQNLVTLTTTGSGAATFDQSTGALNIPTSSTTITSGTYTPTFTAVSNVTSMNIDLCHYKRVGNEVTVSGGFNTTVTTSGGQQFTLSLPIASDMTAAGDLTGFGVASNNVGDASIILQATGDTTTDTAQFTMQSGSATAGAGKFSFTYTVK